MIPWYALRFGIDLYTSNVLCACKTCSIHNVIYKTSYGWNGILLGQSRQSESPFFKSIKGFLNHWGEVLRAPPPHQSSFPRHIQVRSTDLTERAPATPLLCANPTPHRYKADYIPAYTAVNTGSLRTSVRNVVSLARVLIDETCETRFYERAFVSSISDNSRRCDVDIRCCMCICVW